MQLRPSTIEVGKKYKHIKHPKTIYFGCEGNFGVLGSKFLIIIGGKDLLGHFVYYDDSEKGREFWNGFVKI